MARGKESRLWDLLKQLPKTFYFQRIESNTGNGIPDVYCMYEGRSFWLELKADDSKNRGLSKWQINWHIKYKRAGGKVFILNRPLLDKGLELLAVNRDSRLVDLVSRTSSSTIQDAQELCCQAAAAAHPHFVDLVSRLKNS